MGSNVADDGGDDVLRVEARPRATLFFETDDVDESTVAAAAAQLCAIRGAWRTAFVRAGGASHWTAVGDRPLAGGLPSATAGPWRLETADAARGTACRLEAVRSPEGRGQPLMSSLRVDFPTDVQPEELTAFMVWAAAHLPVWWGTAGFAFERAPSWGFLLDDDPVRALAKRYWAVQVLDPVLLLRDARSGMPGVGWLSLVGSGFAGLHGLALDALAGRCAGTAGKGVFHRLAEGALVIAAGPRPILGDINLDEDLTAHACAAGLLAPLLSTAADPGAGPQQHPERYAAWLARYAEPTAWLDAR